MDNAQKLAKAQAITAAVTDIEKQFGKGAIMRLGEAANDAREVPVISTGSLGLDIAGSAGTRSVGVTRMSPGHHARQA
jgi:recombination protein RecA